MNAKPKKSTPSACHTAAALQARAVPGRSRRSRRLAPRPGLRAAATLLGLALHEAQAAGGHHAVDDAALLEPGQCQVETWADRERGGARTLVHVGPACRVGPVELGLNLDRMRQTGEGAVAVAGPQLKWAVPLTTSLSAGVALAAAWQDGSGPRFAGSTVVFPLTWQAAETLAVHVNLGRDFRRQGADTNRSGAALEWAATPQWSLVAERFRESAANFGRLGARYAVNDAVSVDLSHARGLSGGAPAWWTLGLNWTFER